MLKKYGKVCLAGLYGNENLWGWKKMTKEERVDRNKKTKDAFSIWYLNLTDNEKVEYAVKRARTLVSFGISNLERRIESILTGNKIYNKPQYWIKQKSYDFWLGEKIILEVQGTYWHCDPRFYSAEDIVKFGEEAVLASDIWKKDQTKKEIAESYDYKVYYLWEYDLNQMTDDEVLEKIKEFLNENKNNKAA